ncbi:MAG: hypothetical protein A2Z20_00820 [Bdellovibrionales bacterium RBG_16_40_8]|nr:MAG: hypothetical protein A2Z20_00820 [Bdellovibrionales bacterium RBG_16_40_8]
MPPANKKTQTIVIKKITIAAAGAHGGSWKVAFADFMTAMMAFFLVMWLVGQSDEVKKSVADYFSTPSIIEYNFSNYGVELTLEKLFLDLVNEPLKAFEQFVKPVDKRPNIMDMGIKKIQQQFLADKLSAYAADIEITSDEITFDIPMDNLFKKDSAEPIGQFAEAMENVRQIVEGLKDTNIYINSNMFFENSERESRIRNLAEKRLDFVMNKVEQGIVRESVDLYGKVSTDKALLVKGKQDTRGYMKFRIKQKDSPKKLETKNNINKKYDVKIDETRDVYDNFVDKLTRKAEGHTK